MGLTRDFVLFSAGGRPLLPLTPSPSRDLDWDTPTLQRAANATSLLSVGSGGRLDLERCVGDTMRGTPFLAMFSNCFIFILWHARTPVRTGWLRIRRLLQAAHHRRRSRRGC